MNEFQNELLEWYNQHKRDLPWRITRDPYIIWVSEIILQQTRVVQVLAYFQRFITEFPDIFTLASTNIEKILLIWQGLGYYNRAMNMKKTAEKLVKERKGVFPDNYKELLQLNGIGPYTAGAIASIAFNEPVPVVDGNVSRVLSRIFGIKSQRKKDFDAHILIKAQQLLDRKNPGTFNQALMEFGALFCTPIGPNCARCKFKVNCYAFLHNKTEELPPRKQKPVQRVRYFHFFFLERGKHILIHKRSAGDIWAGLYELPQVETTKPEHSSDLHNRLKETSWYKLLKKNTQVPQPIVLRHKLTHQTIIAGFYHLKLDDSNNEVPAGYTKIQKVNCSKYAFPKPIVNYLAKKLPTYGSSKGL